MQKKKYRGRPNFKHEYACILNMVSSIKAMFKPLNLNLKAFKPHALEMPLSLNCTCFRITARSNTWPCTRSTTRRTRPCAPRAATTWRAPSTRRATATRPSSTTTSPRSSRPLTSCCRTTGWARCISTVGTPRT